MERKKLFPLIIVGLLLLDIVFSQIVYRVYLSTGSLSSDTGYTTYVALTMFATFFLTNSFYVMVLIYFREHKSLTNFSALMIIVSFSFAGYVTLSNIYNFDTIIIKMYAAVSYFFAFANIILATSIVLQEIHTKRVSVSLLYFAVITFVFGTLVTDYVRGNIVAFFGASPENIAIIYNVYDIFLIVLQISVAVLQVLAIRSLLDVKSGHKRVVRALY